MADLSELIARQSAAGGMMRDEANPQAGAPPGETMPDDLAMPEQDPAAAVESALGMLETAIQSMDPSMQKEIHQHTNAIREIASKDAGPAAAGREAVPEGVAPEEPKIKV